MPPIEDGDDFVVAIPDDELVDIKGSGAAQSDATGTPVNKREKEPQARVSPLARGRERDPDVEDRRKAEAVERERDEARRLAAEAQARAEALQARLVEESTARVQAEDTGRLREDQAMRAHWASLESKKSQLEVAMAAQKAAAASAERDVIEATEKGDAVKLAAAQRAIARAEAALQTLESGILDADRRIDETRRLFSEHDEQRAAAQAQRAQLEQQRRQQAAEEARRRQEQQQQAPDPDAWINNQARQALGDDGADWLRTNREFVTDEKRNRAFLRFADQYADDHGKDALKSPEFLDALNERFLSDDGEEEKPARRSRRQAEPENDGEAERPRSRVASAPVSRGGNQFFSSRNLNASQVKLPPALATFVRQAGLDPTQYALGVVADIKAGKLPKNFLDPDYDHTA
jgi:hypothetical protein